MGLSSRQAELILILLEQYGLTGSSRLDDSGSPMVWRHLQRRRRDHSCPARPSLAAVPNVKYLVIGRGDDQPRSRVSWRRIWAWPSRSSLPGLFPLKNYANHYRLADAYVMPSQEGFGIVYLEAMACGVPVCIGGSGWIRRSSAGWSIRLAGSPP
jgi:phosphatidylinositol alpha-1,6-mannosyltransferase